MTNHDVLTQLEDILAVAIPRRVKTLKITEPVYCLRIWYNGTDCMPEDRTPTLMLAKETYRQWILGKAIDDAPHYLWCADELEGGDKSMQPYRATLTDPAIGKLCRDWFDSQPETDLPSDGDLDSWRAMHQRVAARLNRGDWSKAAAVTDDFVVMAADGTHSFCDDLGEMTASVPASRIAQFRARGLLWRDT